MLLLTVNPMMIFHLGVKSVIKHQCSLRLVVAWGTAAWFPEIRVKVEAIVVNSVANNPVEFVFGRMHWRYILLPFARSEYLVRISDRVFLRRMIRQFLQLHLFCLLLPHRMVSP